MTPAAACAIVLVDELVRHGVRDAVLCPGSRSAPLAFALHDADTDGRLRLHVRTDERSAAFLALGLARGSGRPVPVVTTSGTAVANLHPAVLEAAHAGIPLLLLTADRPPELRGTGANQTTDQVGIFGAAVRWQHDLGTPDGRPGQQAGWRSTVSRAVAAATGVTGPPGPAHLNLPLREPLMPGRSDDVTEVTAGRPDGRPWVRLPAPLTAQHVAEPVPVVPRTLVLVGDLPDLHGSWGQDAAGWAAAHGWPVIAEPSAGAARDGAVPHGALLLDCTEWLAGHRPDRVIVVGHVTLARSTARLLADPTLRVEVVGAPGPWPDPAGQAAVVHPLPILRTRPAGPPSDPAWASAWQQAGQAVGAAVGPIVAAGWPTGTAVARVLADSLPADAWVFAGSSNAIRDLDLATAGAGPRVLAGRGLAGIDGCVSTATGLALTHAGPTYALVGDLTFLHDLGGLVIGPDEPQPDLTVVVLDDDGGGIFATLEPGAPDHAAAFTRIFATPHGRDLRAVALGLGVPVTSVGTPSELADALARPPHGLHVVQVRTDRSRLRALHTRLRAAAAQAVLTVG